MFYLTKQTATTDQPTGPKPRTTTKKQHTTRQRQAPLHHITNTMTQKRTHTQHNEPPIAQRRPPARPATHNHRKAKQDRTAP